MNNIQIRKAFERKVEQVAVSLGLPVAWENIKFTPPISGLFLEVDYLPASNEDFTIQGTATIRRGVYQITVVSPIDSGVRGGEDSAMSIVEAFGNNTALATDGPPVYVNGEPSVFSGIRDNTGYRTPISIAYVVTA